MSNFSSLTRQERKDKAFEWLKRAAACELAQNPVLAQNSRALASFYLRQVDFAPESRSEEQVAAQ